MDELVALLQVWSALAVAGVLLVAMVLFTAMRLGWADFEEFPDEVEERSAD